MRLPPIFAGKKNLVIGLCVFAVTVLATFVLWQNKDRGEITAAMVPLPQPQPWMPAQADVELNGSTLTVQGNVVMCERAPNDKEKAALPDPDPAKIQFFLCNYAADPPRPYYRVENNICTPSIFNPQVEYGISNATAKPEYKYICTDDTRKKGCAVLNGDPYMFVMDGGECEGDGDCYQGNDLAWDCRSPSRCELGDPTMDQSGKKYCRQVQANICGNRILDGAEECDGGDYCNQQTCFCEDGFEPDPNDPGSCRCPMMGANTCCEDLDENGDGIITNDEAEIESGPFDSCGVPVCGWCDARENASPEGIVTISCLLSSVEKECATCEMDENGEYPEACVIGGDECFNEVGACGTPCDEDKKIDCYITRDGKRYRQEVYSGGLSCNMQPNNDPNALDSGICEPPSNPSSDPGGQTAGDPPFPPGTPPGGASGGDGNGEPPSTPPGTTTGDTAGDDGGNDGGDPPPGNSSVASSNASCLSEEDANDAWNQCGSQTAACGIACSSLQVGSQARQQCYQNCLTQDAACRAAIPPTCSGPGGSDASAMSQGRKGSSGASSRGPDGGSRSSGASHASDRSSTRSNSGGSSTQSRSSGGGSQSANNSGGSNGSSGSNGSAASCAPQAQVDACLGACYPVSVCNYCLANGAVCEDSYEGYCALQRVRCTAQCPVACPVSSASSRSSVRSGSSVSSTSSGRSGSSVVASSVPSGGSLPSSTSSISSHSSTSSISSRSSTSSISSRSSTSSISSGSSRSSTSSVSSTSSISSGSSHSSGSSISSGSSRSSSSSRSSTSSNRSGSSRSSTSSGRSGSSRSNASSNGRSDGSGRSSIASVTYQNSSSPNNCNDDLDCPAGNFCIEGQCTTCNPNTCALGAGAFCESQGQQCRTTADALSFCFKCDDRSSVSSAENSSAQSSFAFTSVCQENADCSGEELCVGGLCVSTEVIAGLPSFCGNGRTDAGEACDEAADNSNRPNAMCRQDCTPARCGDGIPDTPLEICDDGNNLNGDGCSSQCTLERTAPNTLPAQVIDLPFETNGNNPAIIAGVPGGQQNIAPNTPEPPSNTDSGPAALIIMISGAAAGYGVMRKRAR